MYSSCVFYSKMVWCVDFTTHDDLISCWNILKMYRGLVTKVYIKYLALFENVVTEHPMNG